MRVWDFKIVMDVCKYLFIIINKSNRKQKKKEKCDWKT